MIQEKSLSNLMNTEIRIVKIRKTQNKKESQHKDTESSKDKVVGQK